MFTNPSTPNLADFVVFALAQGVPAADLPSVSPYPSWARGYALSVALCAPADLPKIIYVMAVYNLAYHHLLRTAQDQSGLAFFTEQRVAFNLFSFVAGPVASSGDDGTNQSLVIPDWMKTMTIQSNNLLKTPWGIQYLEYAQAYGPTIVGCS